MLKNWPTSTDMRMNDWIGWLQDNLGSVAWLPVYASLQDEKQRVSLYSALAPRTLTERVLSHFEWDIDSAYFGRPAFMKYGPDEEDTSYLRFGDDSGMEPLMLCRHFGGLRQPHVEISEEFRLFHNLACNERNETYIRIDNAGYEEDVIRMDDGITTIQLRSISQFLSAKEMDLVVYFIVERTSSQTLEELGMDPTDASSEFGNERMAFGRFTSSLPYPRQDAKTYSVIVGKAIIRGGIKEDCGIWPYEKAECPVRFVVDTDTQGNEIESCCGSPECVDAGSDSYGYLTPVFFTRDVMHKYYDDTSKYAVSDGGICCGTLWRLPVDNNHEKYVIAYLGDLGLYLPIREQQYWRSFNIAPDGTISNVAWNRDFAAQFVDPERPDLLFKLRYSELKKAWQDAGGWSLFLPLAQEDEHCLAGLRSLASSNQSEFDRQVLSLAKILVDSLNEKELTRQLPAGPDDEKGIAKLERFLTHAGVTGFEQHIKFLRDLQSLRSTGSAHRKGSGYTRSMKALAGNCRDLDTAFDTLLVRACGLLEDFIAYTELASRAQNA